MDSKGTVVAFLPTMNTRSESNMELIVGACNNYHKQQKALLTARDAIAGVITIDEALSAIGKTLKDSMASGIS